MLRDGYEWNPLRAFPRNLPCPCGSQKKFKVCCLDSMPAAVKADIAAEYREGMKTPELIRFVNDAEAPALTKVLDSVPFSLPPDEKQAIARLVKPV